MAHLRPAERPSGHKFLVPQWFQDFWRQAAAWQAAWQGVGLFRVVAFGGQWPGKLVASAWQARGKLVASGPFLWQALVAAIWEGEKVCVFNISGLENPAQVPFV